jgi:hypothetical protein
MAIDKRMLQKFLDNPAMFSPEDMGLSEGEEMSPDESTDESVTIPAIDPEADLTEEAPEISDPDELNQENDLIEDESEVASLAPSMPQSDSEDLAKLKKLRMGESLDDSSENEIQDIASDMGAPMDLRKKALQRIKQKYLGQ